MVRSRKAHAWTDRQRDRYTHTETDKQTDIQTRRHRDAHKLDRLKEGQIQLHREGGTKTEKQMVRHKDAEIHTYGQTERGSDKHKQTHT